MKLLFSFYYGKYDHLVFIAFIETDRVPSIGETFWLLNTEYKVIRVVSTIEGLNLLGKPYIDLEIVPKTLKEKLCVSWRKLLKLIV